MDDNAWALVLAALVPILGFMVALIFGLRPYVRDQIHAEVTQITTPIETRLATIEGRLQDWIPFHPRKNLTWTCHVCGQERPDEKISVFTKPLVINGQVCGQQNIRYCNDNDACIKGAPDVSFFGKE